MSSGAFVVARALAAQGVTVVFGVVGIPVIEVAEACALEGIAFVGTRTESTAVYAAGAYGFLTGTPGVCLVVSGPGLTNALSGMANAKENSWPILVLAGSSEQQQENMGAFQEFPQVEACRLYAKLSTRPASVEAIPFVVEKALRTALAGRPGATYIDLPANFITAAVDDESAIEHPAPYRTLQPVLAGADPRRIDQVKRALADCKRPLIVIGKGVAYARMEAEMRRLVDALGVPFLPTPMAKGVVPDSHPLCASAARSQALRQADCVLLFGARLNWILHFGKPPRYSPELKYVAQYDISEEELGNNISRTTACIPVLGSLELTIPATLAHMRAGSPTPKFAAWVAALETLKARNSAAIAALKAPKPGPMNYYHVFDKLAPYVSGDVVVVSEGANTMDISRTMVSHDSPRRRLDAGSFGTMGVGLGFAIAAKIVYPTLPLVVIQGDSAFGFSAMDVETLARHRLTATIVIFNNNGIYSGIDAGEYADAAREAKQNTVVRLPSTSYLPDTRYDKMAEMVGGRGWFVRDQQQLERVLADVMPGKLAGGGPLDIVNVAIDTTSTRKSQEFSWLTRAKM